MMSTPSKTVKPTPKTKAAATPVRRRDRQATKKALIAAGENLFARHGFKGVTLDMLALESGANKAMVSYYFGSKEGLYDAVIEALVGDVVATVTQTLKTSGDPVKNFSRYISALGNAFVDRDSFCAILMREYIEGSMQEREAPFRQVLQFYQMTESFYLAGRKARLFRSFDIHQLHLSIVGPLVHFVLTQRLRDRALAKHAQDLSDPSMDVFAKQLARLILGGVCVKTT